MAKPKLRFRVMKSDLSVIPAGVQKLIKFLDKQPLGDLWPQNELLCKVASWHTFSVYGKMPILVGYFKRMGVNKYWGSKETIAALEKAKMEEMENS
jgi:hypothetical protein